MTTAVLVHGVGLDRHMWAPFQAAYAGPTHTYDMIGLGDGPRPPGPYSLRQYGEQLADQSATAAQVSRTAAATRTTAADAGDDTVPPVDVIGFSMGALVALRFAIDHPHLVRRLIVVNGVFDRTPTEQASIRARVDEVRAGGYAATIEPALSRWFTPRFARAHPAVVELVRQRMLANDVAAYADAYAVFADGDGELTDRVREIAVPVLAVTGADDLRSTPAMAEALARATPDGRAVILPGLRHLVPLEAPGRLAELAAGFLGATQRA